MAMSSVSPSHPVATIGLPVQPAVLRQRQRFAGRTVLQPEIHLQKSQSSLCGRRYGTQAFAENLPGRLTTMLAASAAASAVQKKRKRKPVTQGKVSPMRHVPPQIARPPYLGPGAPRHPSQGLPAHEFSAENGKVEIKSEEQVAGMREACRVAREALEVAGRMVAPGITTEEIDVAVFNFCVERGVYPSPLGYAGYPKSVCTSVNDIICHGIPDSRPLEDGDIVNVDVTVYVNGYHGDTSSMFIVGRPKRSAVELCEAAQKALFAGIEVCGPGVDFREVGKAIAAVTREHRCHCSNLFTGHGIGKYFHGAPEVIPVENDTDWGVMKPGMTFTIEPILVENEDDGAYDMWNDDWTLQTISGNWTAQFEHTLLITDAGHEILTGPSIEYKSFVTKAAKARDVGAPPAAGRARKRGGGFG